MKYLLVGILFMAALPVSAQEYTFSSKESVRDFIWGTAVSYGYNPQRAVAIAQAESQFDINAHNKASSASGLFQMIDSTYMMFCVKKYNLADSMASKNDPAIQSTCAIRMLVEGGEKNWSASESVWNPSYSL